MSTIARCIGTFRIAAENLAKNLVIISAALLLLPCHAGADELVRIGIFLSLSGTRQQEGSQALREVRISHKLRPTALGRPVQLVIADAQSDPAQAASAMFRLVERDRVSAVIGDVLSSTSMAVSYIAERQRIPMIAPIYVSDGRRTDSRYVFPIRACSGEEALRAAEMCRDRLAAETAVVVADIAEELSIRLADTFRRAFVGAGGRILRDMRIRAGQTDVRDALSRIAAAKPDVIYAPIFEAECVFLAKQSRNLGLVMPIVFGSAVRWEAFKELDPRQLEGIYVMSTRQRSTTLLSANKISWSGPDPQAAYPSVSRASMAVDAYLMLLEAIERAGSAQPEAIRQAIAKVRDRKSGQVVEAQSSNHSATRFDLR